MLGLPTRLPRMAAVACIHSEMMMMQSNITNGENSQQRQVECRFFTKLEEKWRVPDTPISVPGDLGRYGLSEVVNALLQTGKIKR